ncbi:zinc finger protein 271-like [Drosophila subpulchrella]|uniref:zinc finger protein 271-like n=1 Tax=Drosophila subpulchrella TaxID=1486046 RepID=UPI0018A16368|nr:zinc finger protein 271-like [Drosophila subpulchrella]
MKEKCRVCQRKSASLANIFEGKQDRGISIAHMISEVTGSELAKGDTLPEFICPPCLQDAQNAFDIIKTYERSYKIFCEAKDAILEDDLSEEEVCLISDSESVEEIPNINGQVKEEKPNTDKEAIEDSLFQDGVDVILKEEIRTNDTKEPHSKDVKVKEEKTDHSDTKIKKDDVSKRSSGYNRKRQCPYCKKILSTHTNLVSHIRGHTGERPFKCSSCPKEFKDATSLKKHEMIHTGCRPFKCSLCPKSYRVKHHIERHLMIHTGERPHPCKLCDKEFMDRYSLNRHMRTHTGERPHKCSICLTAFADLSNLRQHTRIHTGERPYKCDYCDRSFIFHSDCKKHLRTHTELKAF